MKLVLAPGAADASEGTVYPDEDNSLCCKKAAWVSPSGEKSDIEHKIYSEKQPGEGFWSVAPGCGDISEGMVWVAVIRKGTPVHPTLSADGMEDVVRAMEKVMRVAFQRGI